jgi:uncharacterized phage protein (TIGR02218 family)
MSLITRDNSEEGSNPIRFFKFERGATVWRYASWHAHVTFLGETWEPSTISTGDVESTNDIIKDTLSIELPITDALAETYLGYPMDVITRLTVYRSSYDELNDYLTEFRGRVSSSEVSGGTLTLECTPIISKLQHVGLRATISRTCRHTLYGSGCMLDKADFLTTGLVVSSVEGPGVAIPAIVETTGNGPYTGGVLVAPDGTMRTITRHSSIYVTLIAPIPSLTAAWLANPSGVTVGLYLGCDRTIAACARLNNRGNFGGFSELPSENPFTSAII